MKWKKLGKIFDPADHALPNNCFGFAQSPQALVFDDFVRIYFSTREKDNGGKYLSHVAYVNFDKQFQRVRSVSSDTVIPLGKLGCFDEHGIFPVNILRDGKRVLAYTTGWNRRVSVSADASVGLAISSDDGVTFQKLGSGPVLTASLHEPFLVCDAFVTKFDEQFCMWYIFGTRWIDDPIENVPQRVYKIAQAVSDDGIEWKRDGRQIIADHLNEYECQALPTVVRIGSRYHMYFCYREATGFRKDPGRGYRLGYAHSSDRITWRRDDTRAGITLSPEGWDSEMMCYPHIFHCDDKVYLLYNGNEFGKHGFGIAVLEQD